MSTITCRTILARSSSALSNFVKSLPVPSSSTLVYTLSANADPQDMPTVLSSLGNASASIGCLSHPLPSLSHPFSCSIMSLNSHMCSTFRSTVPGREKISVGRWPNLSQKDTSSSQAVIEGLPSSKHDASAFILLSDDAPEGLLKNLDREYAAIPKLGVLAAATPFVTGRPFTFMKDAEVHSSGAVGLLISANASAPSIRAGYEGLLPMSNVYTITSVASNLVHSIDGKNPTQELMALIREHGIADINSAIAGKEVDLYLAVANEDTCQAPERVYRLIAGGPSKGTLALDAETGPPAGAKVKFMYRKPGSKIALPPLPTGASAMEILNSSIEDVSDSFGDLSQDVVVMNGRFLVASDKGALVGPPNRESWCNTVTGAWTAFDWHS